ncbi:MAG: C40 family peptidase [Micrococcus sp.]|nr:C40 family peptidase [Micrococcus sp.]
MAQHENTAPQRASEMAVKLSRAVTNTRMGRTVTVAAVAGTLVVGGSVAQGQIGSPAAEQGASLEAQRTVDLQRTVGTVTRSVQTLERTASTVSVPSAAAGDVATAVWDQADATTQTASANIQQVLSRAAEAESQRVAAAERAEREAAERAAAAEAERVAQEQAAAERVAAEQAEAERQQAAARQAEQAAAEQAEQEAAAQRWRERVAAQQAEQAAAREAEQAAAAQRWRERVAAQQASSAASSTASSSTAARPAAVATERTAATQPAQTAPAPAASTGNRSGAVSAAYAGVGNRYVFGGKTRAGWDCSGFVSWAYAQAGMSIPAHTGSIRASSKTRPTSNPQPGDLVFQRGGAHVGIYVGNGMMVSALNPAEGTKVHPVSWMPVSGYYTYTG